MGLMLSFTPIYISAIQFKLTNNTDETFQVTMNDPSKFAPGFSSQLTPKNTDEARVSQQLVAWCAFCSKYMRSCLVSSLQAQGRDGVDLRPAYTIAIAGSPGMVTVSAVFVQGQSPVYSKDGDFPKYDVILANPPPISGTTMTCTAQIQNK